MKKTAILLPILSALSAHAEISLIKPMTPAECTQLIRDAYDMYHDSQFCKKEDTEQTRLNGRIGWFAAGFTNNGIAAVCPNLKRMTDKQEKDLPAPYPKSDKPEDTARFCSNTNRSRIAKLYPKYFNLLQEYEAASKDGR